MGYRLNFHWIDDEHFIVQSDYKGLISDTWEVDVLSNNSSSSPYNAFNFGVASPSPSTAKNWCATDYDHFGNLIHRELADDDLLVIFPEAGGKGQPTL